MEFHLSTFLFTIANFFILLAILNKLLYKPMLAMLDERKKTIADSLNQAQAARAEADKIKADYEVHLNEAKKEAQEIIARANKMGEEMREEMVTKAKTEAEKVLLKAQAEIAREKDQAVNALRQEVATLAVLAAGKVVSKSLTVEDHQQMVEEFVNEVGDLKC